MHYVSLQFGVIRMRYRMVWDSRELLVTGK